MTDKKISRTAGVSRRSFTLGAVAGGAALGAGFRPGAALAQDFPTKPIKVIVPFKPGGRTDAVARLIADKIQEKGLLPQPMVIVNADGGAGANAVSQMKRAEVDGHTIVHWQHQLLIAIAMQLGNFSLDDFASIGYTGGGSPVWVVNEDSDFQSLDELIAYAKENPGELVEAVGIGSIPHLVGIMLKNAAGFETRLVTANSGADRLRMVLGGNADIGLMAGSEYLAASEGVRPLVYFGKERLEQLPDVPTATELGYDVTWANPNWWLAPAGTPQDRIDIIAGALEKAIADPEIVEYFKANTLEPYWTGPEESMADAEKQLKTLSEIAATL